MESNEEKVNEAMRALGEMFVEAEKEMAEQRQATKLPFWESRNWRNDILSEDGRQRFRNFIDVLTPTMDLMKQALADDEEHLHRSGAFDVGFRDILSNAETMLCEIRKLFSLTNANQDWDNQLKSISEKTAEEANLKEVLADNPFLDARSFNTEYEGGFEPEPDTFFFMKGLLYDVGLSVFGAVTALTRHISRKNKLENVNDIFPVESFDGETIGGIGAELIQYTDSFTGFDYPMTEKDGEEISDLIQHISNHLITFGQMLQHLPVGDGPYQPTLSDVTSHVVTNKNNPRQTYRNLGMWPLEDPDEWRDLSVADVSNWLGMEWHSQTIPLSESHRIVYRDFLDYIQSLGYVHQKVTTYFGNERRQPVLETFIWKKEKRKYRPNAHIYFYNPECQIARKEMRLVFESHKSNSGIYIKCIVGLNLMESENDLDDEEAQYSRRRNAEDFLEVILEGFDQHQRTSGLLKNAKFSAVFKELNLKGRTFNDIILADTKRDLLEDNIFNILQHSDRLIQRGVETNRGIMLAGPPGVGKSMTIDAIIDRGSCTVLFATFNMLHKAMKEIFQVARKYAPTILILEDIDALGITGQRGDGGSGVGLSTLLNCMDGIDSNNGVITIATSNHPEHMDWALVARPGRFDVRIDYPYPDQAMLQGILELKLSRYACEENLNLASLVKRMPHGFTGSHMQDIVNQANYISLGQTSGDAASVKITMQALKQSFERTLYNFEKFLAERPGLVFSEAEGSRDHFFN